jgi:hypothetical protein
LTKGIAKEEVLNTSKKMGLMPKWIPHDGNPT